MKKNIIKKIVKFYNDIKRYMLLTSERYENNMENKRDVEILNLKNMNKGYRKI